MVFLGFFLFIVNDIVSLDVFQAICNFWVGVPILEAFTSTSVVLIQIYKSSYFC